MLIRKSALAILVFFVGVSTPRCYAEQPSVGEILRNVSETYQKFQSYMFFAEKTTEIASVGSIRPPQGGLIQSNAHNSTSAEIMLAGMTPGMFRLEVKGEGGGVVLVSDGKTEWGYLPKRKQYTEEAASSAASDLESAGNAQPVLKSYRQLLVDRFRVLSQYSSTAVLEKDNQLKIGRDRVTCYVIKIQTPQGENEIWVDKDRYVVWRSRYVGPAASEGISFQTTITVNLTEAKVNTVLEKSLFQFTPPEKAVKVSSLESKK